MRALPFVVVHQVVANILSGPGRRSPGVKNCSFPVFGFRVRAGKIQGVKAFCSAAVVENMVGGSLLSAEIQAVSPVVPEPVT